MSSSWFNTRCVREEETRTAIQRFSDVGLFHALQSKETIIAAVVLLEKRNDELSNIK